MGTRPNGPADFFARVKRGEACWLWQGSVDRDGYGRLRYQGRRLGAHQLAWALARGPIPKGLCVLHRCDVPACVNPEHLFLGTNAENMADKIAKGRQTTGEALAAPKRGERNNLAKLTEEKVRMIRSDPGTNRDVAARFGVVPSVISMVRNRRIWRHVA